MSTEPASSLDLVMAKLDRQPQDPLHAAVVLEAWAGRTPDQSMREADGISAAQMPGDVPSPRPVPTETLAEIKEFAVLVTVLASVFLWLPAMRDLLGTQLAPTMAWALPAALALDRALRVRYLAAGHIRSILSALIPLNIGSVVAITAAQFMGTAASIGVAVTIIWGHAGIFAVRKWPLVYINIVIGSASWIHNDGPVDLVLIVAVAAVLVASTTAVLTTTGDRRIPASVWVTTAAAISGGCAGVMLTADATMWRDNGWGLGFAVVAVSLSGWWGSARLSRLWLDLPSRLADVDADDADIRWGGVVVSDAVVGALIRIILPTYALLILCVALGESAAAALVAAFSMFAIAMLLLGLTVATKHWTLMALISVVAAGVAIAVPPAIPGLPLLAGAGAAAVGFGIVAIVSFRDSATTFATRMLIG